MHTQRARDGRITEDGALDAAALQATMHSAQPSEVYSVANAWLDNGIMRRKDALLLAKKWTRLGYSIKLIHAGHKRFHVYLRIRRD